MQKFYVTTPIYYINDKPHIGSAYTTIAADILARYYRGKGVETFFLTGTAEHGSKISASAEKAGKETQAFADEMSAKFSMAWDVLNITNNDFIRTTEPRHEAAVKEFFTKLKDSGKLYEKDYEGLYCVGHEAFVKEADLVDGLCPEHKTKPEMVKEKNWFFRLSDYQQILKEKISSGEISVQPEERRNEVLAFIDRGLEDIAVSRQNAKFALPLPWDESQTIYVWLDELFNYCSAIGYENEPEKFKKFWPADLHLVGKDIIKFHCVIWPALLLAIGEQPPKKVFAHGFFTVGGQKISKTIGNIIDPIEWADKYGADAVRYFLFREVPFGQDGDVSEEKLKARYEGDLANGLGNLVARLTNLAEKYLPAGTPIPQVDDIRVDQINSLMESMKYREALQLVWQIISECDLQLEQQKPWELIKTDEARVIMLLTELLAKVRFIGQTIAPVMPATAERIAEIFTAEAIRKPANLFNRLES
jgi:methionyl-tRNA synthetase